MCNCQFKTFAANDANMSGQYNGVQAFIQAKQRLAIFVHCTEHISNLVGRNVAN